MGQVDYFMVDLIDPTLRNIAQVTSYADGTTVLNQYLPLAVTVLKR